MHKTFSVEALMALYSIPSIGPAKMRKLISIFDSPQAVLDASARQLMNVEGIDHKTAEKIKSGPDEKFVREQMELIKSHEVKILTYWDKQYPERLKKIYDPPAFLFVKGNIDCLNGAGIGVVGSRVPSTYGKIITEQFTRELVQNDFTIVSGFARGVDTIAHKTAIKNNGVTIAVLGNGVDLIYPSENAQLRSEILSKGAVISEYPMKTNPDAVNFPKRNRIISGLSYGVLITEAGAKSGALITAFYALDQNREVFSVPGPVNSGKSAGTNRLIKEGAKLVQGVQDILVELPGQINLTGKIKASVPPPDLNGSSKVVYDLLSSEPLYIDQIAIKADLSTAETLGVLLSLELMNLIRQMAGKMFVRL